MIAGGRGGNGREKRVFAARRRQALVKIAAVAVAVAVLARFRVAARAQIPGNALVGAQMLLALAELAREARIRGDVAGGAGPGPRAPAGGRLDGFGVARRGYLEEGAVGGEADVRLFVEDVFQVDAVAQAVADEDDDVEEPAHAPPDVVQFGLEVLEFGEAFFGDGEFGVGEGLAVEVAGCGRVEFEEAAEFRVFLDYA